SLLLINLLTFSSLHAQTSVSGYVFEDTNANNKKDRREKGDPNVSVSNGREVVLTDKKGRYTLPVGDDNIIFVIKPSNVKVPLDENNLPASYYIHKPNGSPELKYSGVSPTGKLPKSVDFALTAHPEKEKFSILVFGD